MAALMAVWVLAGCASPGRPVTRPSSIPARAPGPARAAAWSGEQVELTVHVMSRSLGAAEVLETLREVVRALGAAVALKLEYIAREDDGRIVSAHGEVGVRGDIVQLCAAAHHPPGRVLEFIACQNQHPGQIPANWERCARSAGLNSTLIGTCISSPRGRQLLLSSMKRSAAAGVTKSPTIVLAGKSYGGARTRVALMKSICGEYAGPAPAACKAPGEAPGSK